MCSLILDVRTRVPQSSLCLLPACRDARTMSLLGVGYDGTAEQVGLRAG